MGPVPHLKWDIDIDLMLVCPTINRLYPTIGGVLAPPLLRSGAKIISPTLGGRKNDQATLT